MPDGAVQRLLTAGNGRSRCGAGNRGACPLMLGALACYTTVEPPNQVLAMTVSRELSSQVEQF